MKTILQSPKTTFGGVLMLLAAGLLIGGKLTSEQAIGLMGLAGAWAGLTARDHDV